MHESEGIELVAGELKHGQAGPKRLRVRPDHAASLTAQTPGSRNGQRRDPPDHSRITYSRHRTAPGGHQRTPSRSISYSKGQRRSLPDTGGHATDTVRDREAPGSNPGPPTKIRIRFRVTTGAQAG